MIKKEAALSLKDESTDARIKVVGLGGGGCNTVNRMIQENIQGVEFIAVNTDAQALLQSEASVRLRIGDRVTKGRGVGGDPVKGAKAAEESQDEIANALQNAELVFITAGMGGGTGTGAAPIAAEIVKNSGALTVAVVTKPFTFEGARRRMVAEEGIARLKDKVDTLLVIPNDRLLSICDKKLSLSSAFRAADEALRQGIQGIAEFVQIPGDLNLDFEDVRAIMSDAGQALMAIGQGSGESRAVDAARSAITSPLLDVSIEGATGVIWNITGDDSLTLFEVSEAAQIISKAVDPNANIIWGRVIDPKMNGDVKITIIATGFNAKSEKMLAEDNIIRRLPTRTYEETDDLDIPPFLRRARAVT